MDALDLFFADLILHLASFPAYAEVYLVTPRTKSEAQLQGREI